MERGFNDKDTKVDATAGDALSLPNGAGKRLRASLFSSLVLESWAPTLTD
jgi:hypothetical protein